MVGNATAFASENAQAVSLVDHKRSLIFVAQHLHFGQLSHIAFHTENAIGNYQLGGIQRTTLQHTLKVIHIIVAILQSVGEGKALALNDRGVVHLVKDDIVVASRNAGNNA